ncbi:MAG: ABC transporter ATP-binding protein [Pseudolysinimonas sp.]
MPESPVLLRVEKLKKVYETGQGAVEAIGDLTFTVRRGELVCIVGPSGAGKTTLLKCIAGLLAPTSGSIELDGVAVTAPPKRMALVFQEYGRSLFPWLTVAANVGLPLKNSGVSRDQRMAKVERTLSAVGLDGQGGKYPWQLSGGMQQRVAIARAVAYDPEILVMDEPFAAVDAQTRADLEDLVRQLWSTLEVTVLFVTHDIDESVYLGERVLVLSSAPTFVQEVVEIDLPRERDQLSTRADPRFIELRTHILEQIQIAKRGDARTKGTA